MSFWKKIIGGPKPDPVRQILTDLLKTQDFTYDVLGILGLERRYEVSLPSGKLYFNVLAYGADCRQKVADLERRHDSAPQVFAWKDREPLLDGRPYILSDKRL